MPATYPTPEYPVLPVATTLTVGELIALLSRYDAGAPVILYCESRDNQISAEQVTEDGGCVVIDTASWGFDRAKWRARCP